MDTLLITGSRDANDYLLAKAREWVQVAYEFEWNVIVGYTEGVDAAVIAECDRLNVLLQYCEQECEFNKQDNNILGIHNSS